MEKQRVESKDKHNEEQSSLMEQSRVVKHSKEIEQSSEKECSSGKGGSRGNKCSSASKSVIVFFFIKCRHNYNFWGKSQVYISIIDCFKDSFIVFDC